MQVEHKIHVQVDLDNPVGFSGLPMKWKILLMKSGINKTEIAENPQAIIDILNHQFKTEDDLIVSIDGTKLIGSIFSHCDNPYRPSRERN